MINVRATRIVASVSQFKIGTFFDGSQIIELTYLLPFLDDIDILPSTFVTKNKKFDHYLTYYFCYRKEEGITIHMRYIRTEECDSYEENCWWDIIFTWSLALASSHILRQHKYVYITLRY